jgi:hypothetical protein
MSYLDQINFELVWKKFESIWNCLNLWNRFKPMRQSSSMSCFSIGLPRHLLPPPHFRRMAANGPPIFPYRGTPIKQNGRHHYPFPPHAFVLRTWAPSESIHSPRPLVRADDWSAIAPHQFKIIENCVNYENPDTSKVVAPPPSVSVKDRWIGPHEKVLNVLIACWCCGPSKPSSQSSIDTGFKPTALMAVRGEKWGGDPWIGQ